MIARVNGGSIVLLVSKNKNRSRQNIIKSETPDAIALPTLANNYLGLMATRENPFLLLLLTSHIISTLQSRYPLVFLAHATEKECVTQSNVGRAEWRRRQNYEESRHAMHRRGRRQRPKPSRNNTKHFEIGALN